MMKKIGFVFVISFLLSTAFGSTAFAQVGEVKKSALITIPGKFEIKAPVNKVWKLVTSAGGFGVLTGFHPVDKSKNLSTVGANVAASIWSDKGTLVTTYVIPGKELRVAWEPTGGHYLCSKRIVLATTPTGTSIEYWDRYTDDQPPAAVDKTLQQTVEETKKAITAFIALAEK